MNPELIKYFAKVKGMDIMSMTLLYFGWNFVEKKEWLAALCFIGAILSYGVTVIFKHDQAMKDLSKDKKPKPSK